MPKKISEKKDKSAKIYKLFCHRWGLEMYATVCFSNRYFADCTYSKCEMVERHKKVWVGK